MVNSMKKIMLILLFFIGYSECYAIESAKVYKKFLQAEEAIHSQDDDKFLALSTELVDYPLYFYLEYQWLVGNLKNTQKVENFLKEDVSSLYSRKLRQKWLNYLYENKHWSLYVEHDRGARNKQLECRYQWARYQSRKKEEALEATKNIWLTGVSLPKDCDSLLNKFKQSSLLTQELIWGRFKLAIYAGESRLAGFLQRRMTDAHTQEDARKWQLLLKDNGLILKSNFLKNTSPSEQADMLVYAMSHMAAKNLSSAMKVWGQQKKRKVLSKEQVREVDRSIALRLAYVKSERAYEYFQQLTISDEVTRAWEVRAALVKGDWVLVQGALDKLSKDEIKLDRWKYWQAKTYLYTNHYEKALEIFNHLAKERSYYGFLAADYVLKDYTLSHQPINVDEKEISALLGTKSLAIITEFRAMQRNLQAKQYWAEVIGEFSKPELVVAAKIAERWQWHKQAILAVAKAQEWNDINLRFPVDFVKKIEENARLQGVSSAFIYGLVRRESMFDELAKSPVGALGLMQVMPKTGKQIAQQIGVPWKSKIDLLQVSTNIKFGTYYYKQMIDKFSGHLALAIAAYNAGPTGVKRWLKIDRNYATDVWIETIPYKETREYVAAVLTYTLIYQRRIGREKNLMIDFMNEIEANRQW